jgi:general secretion pathway protein K
MKQRGVALILVLWVLSILTLMASSFTLTMRRETASLSHTKENAQALAQAKSGLALAQAMLLHEDETKRWRIDGSIYEIETDNSLTRIRILSETGKIDLNSAPQTLLHHVLQFSPLEMQAQLELENAILDWRDEDENTRPFGAEKAEYKAAKLSYAPRNKPFRSFEELQMLKGMTAEVLAWMQPIFTIYAAGQTQVEVDVASREVLNVLPEVDVNLLEAYFLAKQKAILNHQPMPKIPRSENAAQAMSQDVEATTETETAPETAPEISVVSISVETILENEATARIDVIVEKADGENNLPFQTLVWKSNSELPSLFSPTLEPFLIAHYFEPEQK